MLAYDKNEEELKFTAQKKSYMQYAKASCCFEQQPLPLRAHNPNLRLSSLKTRRPAHPTHTDTLIHGTTRNTITSLSLLVWKKMKHCEAPNPPPQPRHPLSLIGGRRRGVGAVVPLVRRRVVHLHRVEEFVAIEATHSVDGFPEHGQACVAARRLHAAQHLPFVAGGVVHFHAAEGVGAIETADNKQFAWTETQFRLAVKTCPAKKKKKATFCSPTVWLTCVDGNTGPPAGHIHGGYKGPSVVVRVVTFHRVQAVPRLCSSSHIHEPL